MSQNAVIKREITAGVVQVSLMRQMECGLSCNGSGSGGGCEACGMRPKEELLALAHNPIQAKPGDIVEVESVAGGAIGIAVLVYLIPCITLAAGYLVGQTALNLGEAGALLPAVVGLALGFLPAWFYNRSISRQKGPEFTILRKLG